MPILGVLWQNSGAIVTALWWCHMGLGTQVAADSKKITLGFCCPRQLTPKQLRIFFSILLFEKLSFL